MVNLLFEDNGNWDAVARHDIVRTGCGQEIEIHTVGTRATDGSYGATTVCTFRCPFQTNPFGQEFVAFENEIRTDGRTTWEGIKDDMNTRWKLFTYWYL